MIVPMKATLYGIPNCDTVRKSRRWLAAHHVDVVFHDFKKLGVSPDQLQSWADAFGWQKLLNRRGTSWRTLSEEQKAAIDTEEAALLWLQKNTSAIKRPIVEWGTDGKERTLGFAPDRWQALLATGSRDPR